MSKLIKIAVDAMGGENSPKKIIDGINLHQKNSKNIIYRLFGDKNIIEPIIKKKSINNNIFEIIHTEDKIKGIEPNTATINHANAENKNVC